MKKIIISSLLLSSIAGSAMAVGGGFYSALGVGVQDAFFKFTAVDNSFNSQDNLTLEQGKTGISGALALGYNWLCSDFLFGFQLDGQISGTKAKIQSYSFDPIDGIERSSITAEAKHSFGLNFRPGYLFNDNASGFLVLGYRHGRFNYNSISSDVDGMNFPNASVNRGGFEFGLGTEISLNEQLGLRLEVTQTRYGSKDLASLPDESRLSSKTTINQGLLSLVWYPELF